MSLSGVMGRTGVRLRDRLRTRWGQGQGEWGSGTELGGALSRSKGKGYGSFLEEVTLYTM